MFFELRSPRTAWMLVMAATVGAAIIAKYFNPNIAFANGPGCDSWYFFGIYENYTNSSAILPEAYQLFRYPAVLPWIYIAPYIPTITFHELKFWTYLIIAAGLFAYSAITLFGRYTGAVISTAFGCSALILGVFSHDYVTGAGLLWETTAIAATLWGAARANQIPGAFLAGCFHALGIHTHAPVAMFMFAAPLLFFAVSTAPRPILSFVKFNLIGVAGIVASTVALSVFSWSIGNPFHFYMGEFKTLFLVAQPGYYARPISDNWRWFAYDTNISFFFAAIGASLVVLIRAALSRDISPRILFPVLAFLPAMVLCFWWEFSGRTVLQEHVYSPWMYPLAFLACGAALAGGVKIARSAGFVLAVFTAIALCAFASTQMGTSATIRFSLALVFVIFCALSFWRYGSTSAAVAFIALLCVTYPTGYGSSPWNSTTNARSLYQQTSAARQFIIENDKNAPVFWISGALAGSKTLELMASITTPRSFLQCSKYAASFPSATRTDDGWDRYFTDLKAAVAAGSVKANDRVFVIAEGKELATAARKSLTTLGLAGRAVAEQSIGNGISIAAIDITPLGANP